MRLDLPGGQWVDIRDVSSLTGADQDQYLSAVEAALEHREAVDGAAWRQPEPQVDPANPAMLASVQEAPKPRLNGADTRELRDLIMGWVITGWSFGHISLPYTSESRKSLPLPVCNALRKAIDPHVDALNGDSPKEEEGSTILTSATTSEATADAPQTEPAGA